MYVTFMLIGGDFSLNRKDISRKDYSCAVQPFPGGFRVRLGVGLEEKGEGGEGALQKVRERGCRSLVGGWGGEVFDSE